MTRLLSDNASRDKVYQSILRRSEAGRMTVEEIAYTGYKLMCKGHIFHHFFAEHSLQTAAKYLTFFSLQIPYDYNNKNLLERKVNYEECIKILKLFERRISERIPIEYLTHEAFYLGNKFYVNENVLVPRSLMNTRFNDFLNEMHWENKRVLDLCTGSGCIGITLALLNPNIKVDLADISTEALKVAQININHYGLENRIRCIQSDLFENIHDKYDLIISNPPYVSDKEYIGQPDEIKNEPAIALRAGVEGLDIIDKILMNAKQYLNPKGTLIVEVGYPAARLLKKKYKHIPFKWFNYRQPSGYESIIDILIRWSGYLDSSFMCKGFDL